MIYDDLFEKYADKTLVNQQLALVNFLDGLNPEGFEVSDEFADELIALLPAILVNAARRVAGDFLTALETSQWAAPHRYMDGFLDALGDMTNLPEPYTR